MKHGHDGNVPNRGPAADARVPGVRRANQNPRIGYASRDERLAFPRAVTVSLREEAGKGGVNPAILFGAEEDVSPALAARVSSAAIPVITIDQPISGAFDVGADNQGVGLALGQQVAIELSGTIRA